MLAGPGCPPPWGVLLSGERWRWVSRRASVRYLAEWADTTRQAYGNSHDPGVGQSAGKFLLFASRLAPPESDFVNDANCLVRISRFTGLARRELQSARDRSLADADWHRGDQLPRDLSHFAKAPFSDLDTLRMPETIGVHRCSKRQLELDGIAPASGDRSAGGYAAAKFAYPRCTPPAEKVHLAGETQNPTLSTSVRIEVLPVRHGAPSNQIL